MIYTARVDGIFPEVEEEVSVLVCGKKLTCFASYAPYELELGVMYEVEFLPMVFDEYVVEETSQAEPSITREGEGYSYRIVGKLKSGCLHCGDLVFCDETLLADFGFLDGRMVLWKIDRLDICFI